MLESKSSRGVALGLVAVIVLALLLVLSSRFTLPIRATGATETPWPTSTDDIVPTVTMPPPSHIDPPVFGTGYPITVTPRPTRPGWQQSYRPTPTL